MPTTGPGNGSARARDNSSPSDCSANSQAMPVRACTTAPGTRTANVARMGPGGARRQDGRRHDSTITQWPSAPHVEGRQGAQARRAYAEGRFLGIRHAAFYPRAISRRVCGVQPRRLAGAGDRLRAWAGNDPPVVAAIAQRGARDRRGSRGDVDLDRPGLPRRLLLGHQSSGAGLCHAVRRARPVVAARRGPRHAALRLSRRRARVGGLGLAAVQRRPLPAGGPGGRPPLSGTADVRHHALPRHPVHVRTVAADHRAGAAASAGDPVRVGADRGQRGEPAANAAGLAAALERAGDPAVALRGPPRPSPPRSRAARWRQDLPGAIR